MNKLLPIALALALAPAPGDTHHHYVDRCRKPG